MLQPEQLLINQSTEEALLKSGSPFWSWFWFWPFPYPRFGLGSGFGFASPPSSLLPAGLRVWSLLCTSPEGTSAHKGLSNERGSGFGPFPISVLVLVLVLVSLLLPLPSCRQVSECGHCFLRVLAEGTSAHKGV